ncbi:hypothetical protein GUITHDRAFT_147819 [Guillardia theta CCMP2712]|uniref:Diphthamide biosynthesis protein 2 n=1 Tax=Guillardia theta (strain CCMP2712) TaxID=905079 RepID=L1IC92_GUITC|nr:hypothetical protein GUITHDRAFT_147819 [Guillardia theta CCMP2712]EKX33549.1 hypothetical protein GUITHDRAFT_147819 [Guillardia theta CCMP2712]|eukprot:XP_005820529.1 hypothetical protein GUITHDRAFT_147819 [Guillardia theta CCMP2712]
MTEEHAQFDINFDVRDTCSWIKEHKMKRIALQIPDEYLKHSQKLVSSLRSTAQEKDIEFYILADSSVSSWDPDVVAAQHVRADCIVMYGRASVTRSDVMPIRNVFGFVQVDPNRIFDVLKTRIEPCASTIVLLSAQFKSYFASDKSRAQNSENTEAEKFTIIYVGKEGPELTRLILEYNQYCFMLLQHNDDFDQFSFKTELGDSSRLIKRRYFLMMKTKDSERIGIVVATTAMEGYRDIVERMKKIITMSGKIVHTLYVGKINPAKLANFAEIDSFVLVASPENTVSIDAADYLKPLITPMELEIALVRGREWTGDYNLDFRPLLKTPLPEVSSDNSDDEDNICHSLTSGAIIRRPNVGDGTLTVTNSKAYEHRTFRGLDLKEGLDRPLDVVKGRVGIASGYAHEPAAVERLSQATQAEVITGSLPAHVQKSAGDSNYGISKESCKIESGGNSKIESTTPKAEAASVSSAGKGQGQGQGEGEDEDEAHDSEGDLQHVSDEVDSFFDAFV